MSPACCKAKMATVQMTACGMTLAERSEVVWVWSGTYLSSQIEKVQVPGRARHDVLVHDGHADRGEAISQNSSAGTVVELRKKAARAAIDASAVVGRRLGQKALALSRFIASLLKVLVLLVRHYAFGRCMSGGGVMMRKARGRLAGRSGGQRGRRQGCNARADAAASDDTECDIMAVAHRSAVTNCWC
jgi:hypothetical protein